MTEKRLHKQLRPATEQHKKKDNTLPASAASAAASSPSAAAAAAAAPPALSDKAPLLPHHSPSSSPRQKDVVKDGLFRSPSPVSYTDPAGDSADCSPSAAAAGVLSAEAPNHALVANGKGQKKNKDEHALKIRMGAYEEEGKEPLSPSAAGSAYGAAGVAPLPSPSPPLPPSSARRRRGSLISDEDEAAREEFLKVARMAGYCSSWWRELRFWLVCALSGFTLWLLSLWFPEKSIPWRYRSVPLSEATWVHVIGQVHGSEMIRVQELGFDVAETAARGGTGAAANGERQWSRRGTRVEEEEKLRAFSASPAAKRRSSYLLSDGTPRGKMLIFRHMRYVYSPMADTFLLQASDAPPAKVTLQQGEQRHTSIAGLKSKELDERCRTGLSQAQWLDNLVLFGENQLNLPIPSIGTLLFREVFHPFYVFQMYTIILWCFEEYWIFTGAIAVMAIVSIIQTLVETRRSRRELAALAKFECGVTVLREGRMLQVSSNELVPGDIVSVSTGTLPCDIVLLDGGAVVNESMLTGEAVPVVKVNVKWPVNRSSSDQNMQLTEDSRNTLFAATQVMQLKPLSPDRPVLGVVVRTAFATTKGSLILSILYPKPSSFKFAQQSYKFVASMFGLALIGFALSVWRLKMMNSDTKTIVIRALDLVTIAVPPSLPLALTVGTNFAMVWLKEQFIFCISPSRINMAGKVRLMAFDKTGTLTENSLEFAGVYPSSIVAEPTGHLPRGSMSDSNPAPASNSSHSSNEVTFGTFQSPKSQLVQLGVSEAAGDVSVDIDGVGVRLSSTLTSDSSEGLEEGMEVEEEYVAPVRATDRVAAADTSISVPLTAALKISMACCQSLAVMDGELIGDPLEQQTFEASNASLQDSGELHGFQQLIEIRLEEDDLVKRMGILEQFEFSSALQRMSVLCRDRDTDEHWSFVKGSPEVMATLCQPNSLPKDYQAVLAYFAYQGYRVIAIARKKVEEVPKLEKAELRGWVESDLTFLGLILLENKVKPETAPTLSILKKAAVRCIMVTGDNQLTGISVAKECGLMDAGTRIFQSRLKAGAQKQMGEEEVFDPRHLIEWVDTEDETLKLDPVTLMLPPEAGKLRYELAVTGPVFKLLQEAEGSSAPESYFHRVLLNGQIFARMSPDQKATLIAELQAMGIYTGMCGDGANDCGALKTAHVGVSLSESEASIAAPFTYQKPNISCIPILLSEGRSSLITSFQLFRYIAMYSVIQFGAVILTYFQGSVLGNWQYLYQDLWLMFPFTIFMGATRARHVLSVKRPSGNLLSRFNLLNIAVHMTLIIVSQVLVYQTIIHQPDFEVLPNRFGPHSYITTAEYYFSNFQYIVMAALFSLGKPFKANILTNAKFSVWVLITLATSAAMLFSPYHEPAFFREDDVPLPSHWNKYIGIYVLIWAACACSWELLFYPLIVRAWKRLRRRGQHTGHVFGRIKVVEGKQSKLYHRLRGEIEMAWRQ